MVPNIHSGFKSEKETTAWKSLFHWTKGRDGAGQTSELKKDTQGQCGDGGGISRIARCQASVLCTWKKPRCVLSIQLKKLKQKQLKHKMVQNMSIRNLMLRMRFLQ